MSEKTLIYGVICAGLLVISNQLHEIATAIDGQMTPKCQACGKSATMVEYINHQVWYFCERDWEARKQLVNTMKAVGEHEPVLTEEAKDAIKKITAHRP